MTLYQPFLDHAIATLSEAFDLQDYPIPEGFDRKVGVTGSKSNPQEVLTTSYAASTDKLRQIRAAHVQAGASLQVLNFVIFPGMDYDLPFFGADLVTLPGGHLIAIDMQPLFHSPEYQSKYSEPLMDCFHRYQQDRPGAVTFQRRLGSIFHRHSYGRDRRKRSPLKPMCLTLLRTISINILPLSKPQNPWPIGRLSKRATSPTKATVRRKIRRGECFSASMDPNGPRTISTDFCLIWSAS
jgi:hypothetical protein